MQSSEKKFMLSYNKKFSVFFSERVDILKTDTEHGINNLTKSVENISEGTNARVNDQIVQTREELDKQGQKIILVYVGMGLDLHQILYRQVLRVKDRTAATNRITI